MEIRLDISCALLFLYMSILCNMTGMICEALGVPGYCVGTVCGNDNATLIKYPFRLVGDGTGNTCYTDFTELQFVCLNATLYLNFTLSTQYSYMVRSVDYTSQILSLAAISSGQYPSSCRSFQPSDFSPLTISATNSSLLLDCTSNVTIPGCVLYNATSSSSLGYTCPGDPPLSGQQVVRNICPYSTVNGSTGTGFLHVNQCRLFERLPANAPSNVPNGSTAVDLHWDGSSANFSSISSSLPIPSAPSPEVVVSQAPPTPSAPSPEGVNIPGLAGPNKPSKTRLIMVVATLSILATLAISCIGGAILLWKSWKKRSIQQQIEKELAKKHVQPLLYAYKEMKLATNNFHPENKLGEGGFGVVYKGILSDGREIAIKKLMNCQQNLDEFMNEVVLMMGTRHRNLVKLEGCCIEGIHRILVYELVENNNLAQALWGHDCKVGPILDWPTRYEICVGIARGLTYLHNDAQPRIIHRDIKPPNILLDKDMKAKIADFGLARLFHDENSHLSTLHIAGTMGYMAPEYAAHGQFTEKVDVYSFGVVVLEVVSGRKNVDFSLSPDKMYLVEWASKCHEEDALCTLIDGNLQGNKHLKEVLHVIKVAMMCIQARAFKRPCMSTVLKMLLGEKKIDENAFNELQIENNNLHVRLLQSQSSALKFSSTSHN